MLRSRLFVIALCMFMATGAVAQDARRAACAKADDPSRFISADSLLEVIEELTKIRAFARSRTATTPGEQECFQP